MEPRAAKRLVIIANVLTPYRVHLHQRLVREIPDIELHTVLTHAAADFSWELDVPEDIHVVGFAAGAERAEEPVWRRPLSEYRKAGRIIRYLADLGPEAVILTGYADLGRLRLIRHMRRLGIPLFLRGDSNVRGDVAHGAKYQIKRRTLPWVLSQTAGVMAMGQQGSAYFDRYGVPDDRIYQVPYEPDTSQLKPAPPDGAAETMRALGLPPDRSLVVFAGRFVEEKRLDLLIDAFTELAPRRPTWDLVVAGDGPLAQVSRERVPVQLRDRVHWTGFLQDDQMKSLFGVGRVLVLPSDFEPWGVVVEEAIAAGLVVIASDVVGAAHELIVDGQSGIRFPAGDRARLIDALLTVTEPEALRKMRDTSAQHYRAWKAQHDPVRGIVSALTEADVLPARADS